MRRITKLSLLILFFNSTFAQCADFKIVADKSSVCAPDIVQFVLTNAVPGSTYEWDVGNGIILSGDTLYSFFDSPQNINAKVTIALPNGSKCVVSESNITQVNGIPIPQFTASNILFCEGPDSIYLEDITPSSASRSWLIDGTNYSNTGKTVSHKFVTPGYKKLSLVVTDHNGCKGVKEFVDTVKIYKNPNLDFIADNRNGCVPQEAIFSITNESHLAGLSKTYAWSFGGSTSPSYVGKTPPKQTYNSRGQFDAELNVKVSNGCEYSIAKSKYINIGDTIALSIRSNKNSVCIKDPVDLIVSPSGLTGTLEWNYSGVSVADQNESNSKSTVIPSSIGNLDVSIKYNEGGCISNQSYNDLVAVKGVKANFLSNDRYHCEVPHTVHLQNLTDSFDAKTIDYVWKIFDNGSLKYMSVNEEDSFTFNKMSKSYDVELVATSNDGCADTMRKNGYIYQDTFRLKFDVAPKLVCTDREFQVLNKTRPVSYVGPDSFYWYFLDRNDIDILDSSKRKDPRFVYSDTGFYDILAVGFNEVGCRDTLLMEDVIEVIRPELDFSISDEILCKNEKFILEGKTRPARALFSHNWIFKHDETKSEFVASGKVTNIAPPLLGSYKAYYMHDINGGCKDTDSVVAYVNGVVAELDLDTSYGCAPLLIKPLVNITEDVHYGVSETKYTYQWTVVPSTGVSIDDASKKNPQIEILEEGDYTIYVKVTNSAGCSYTASSRRVLTGVRSGFTLRDNIICLGDYLKIDDKSYNGVSALSWSLSPDKGQKVIKDGASQYKILMDKPGEYTIQQQVTNNNICFDTLERTFTVIEVKAAFTAVDSFIKCAPVFAEFQSTSLNADTLIWDFGQDEELRTTSSSAGVIYKKK